MIRIYHLPTLIIFVVYAILTTIHPIDYSLIYQKYYSQLVILAIPFIFLRWKDLTNIKFISILNAFCMSAGIEIIYICLQWAGLMISTYKFQGTAGSLVNPSIMGLEFSFYYLASFYLFTKSLGTRKYILACISMLFMLFVILSDSRTALISSCVSSFIILFRECHIKIAHIQKFIIILFIVVIFISILLFFYKIDSVKGRILIWIICGEMIFMKPLCGWGSGGFKCSYMNFQAKYFKEHPNSAFSNFSDNINQPFNEYIHGCIQFGIPLVIIIICISFYLINYVRLNKTESSTVTICCIVNIMIWSMFSYPLKFPFTWIIIAYVIYGIIYSLFCHQNKIKKYLLLICWTIIAVISSYCLSKQFSHDISRLNAHKQIFFENKEITLKQYSKMLKEYNSDECFLYDYGSILHYFGDYEASLVILKQCSLYLSDYNLQLLIADDYSHLNKPEMAIRAFEHASAMVPSKFLPLYHEMVIYENNNDTANTIRLAKHLIVKPAKFKKSKAIKEIKQKAQYFSCCM